MEQRKHIRGQRDPRTVICVCLVYMREREGRCEKGGEGENDDERRGKRAMREGGVVSEVNV